DESGERRQLAAPGVVLDELEVDLVQLKDEQTLHGADYPPAERSGRNPPRRPRRSALALLQEKPCGVVEREAVAVIHEPVVDELKAREAVEHLAGEVALEELAGMPPVGHFHGGRIVV